MINEGAAMQAAQNLTQDSQPVALAVDNLVINNDGEYQVAAQYLVNLKERMKVVEEKRKEFTKPLYDLQKKLNAFFKEPLNNYAKAEFALKSAMSDYQHRKEEERKAALEAAKQAAAEENKNEFTTAMVKAADNIAPEAQGTYTVDTVKFEVTNPELVPREHLMVNEASIRKAVNAIGAKAEIPGVRVWVEKSIRARTS